jgi:integrase
MRIRFYLEKRKDSEGRLLTNDRPVLMGVSFNGERVMLGSGIRMDMEGWDPVRQRVRHDYPGASGLNNWMETLEDTARKTWSAVNSDGIKPGADQFRETFRQLKPYFSQGFFQIFYEFLESGYTRWSISTYRKVRTIYNHLREFEVVTGYSISFRSLDETFIRKFTRFYVEKGNNHTTCRKAINILVWFLNWATRNGYNIYTEYRGFYKMLESEPSGIKTNPLYLKWEELMRLVEYQPGNRKMERVRDLFCFMCFSGLRFSEIQSLRKEDINDVEILVRSKSRRIRKIPMNRYTREIYRRYENRFYRDNTAFPSLSIITFIKYLRLIGREAGIDREVNTPGTEVKPFISCPLYDRLTAGIAVNTFIANALELEIPMEILSSFTGVSQDARVMWIKSELTKEEMGKFDGLR